MFKVLNLPPVPSPLKLITPYLQRADELYQKEPVVAYWCTYYAAQTGISVKARDTASRDFLSQLLGKLEDMKQEIGPNDAIDMEAASAAYVENFALKVFGAADNEDRRGGSTRSTAKKFLAAANFLEVLKTFPKTEISESVEEKVRYAKWKAADIAKAFREGRKPTPGPAGGEPMADFESETVPTPIITSSTSISESMTSPNHAPSSSSPSRSPKQYSPPAIKRPSPPPVIEDMPPAQPITPPRPNLGIDGHTFDPTSPGNWSTAATPGATTVSGTPMEGVNNTNLNAFPGFQQGAWTSSPLAGKTRGGQASTHTREGSNSSNGSTESARTNGSGTGRQRKDSTSTKKVHFSPTVGAGPPPTAPPPFGVFPPPNAAHPTSISPPPASFDPALLGFQPSAGTVPPPPTIQSQLQHSHHSPVPPPPPPSAPMSGPKTPTAVFPPEPKPVEVELTPQVIAKAQKHCRFAISALDYEDAAQARKELRAALAALGE
ncbi:hypothetical protein VNI00_002046 [Paramarasmius palmivorus]|uniref:DUF605-domain-containing protein n=1 Tax=Paramarasmius palmivorus TaxID=297713 RepID=A0AAW0E3R2_9AGAR